MNTGQTESKFIFLIFVEEPVELESGLQDVVVTELHSSAEFRLKVSKADCKVTWLYGSSEITESKKYTAGEDDLQPYLKVNDVTGKDEGTFTAKVEDITSSAKLLVQGNCFTFTVLHVVVY